MKDRILYISPTRCGNTEFRWGEKTYVMGIINLSTDSFSADGIAGDLEAVVARAKHMVAEGANIIDVGGKSTRPGAKPISIDEELRRVIPAIERLNREVAVPISLDTYKSEVARQAIEAGAQIINDIWGLKQDNRLAEVAASAGVPIILTSNQRNNPVQGDIISEVISSLQGSIRLAKQAGVTEENIIIDPGIGFGKSVPQNLEIICRLAELKAVGRPILLGTSRKFMQDLPPEQRIEATAATIAIGIANGADMVRVHEVKEMARVCRMSDAIIRGTKGAK